jgi:hypothetical protein
VTLHSRLHLGSAHLIVAASFHANRNKLICSLIATHRIRSRCALPCQHAAGALSLVRRGRGKEFVSAPGLCAIWVRHPASGSGADVHPLGPMPHIHLTASKYLSQGSGSERHGKSGGMYKIQGSGCAERIRWRCVQATRSWKRSVTLTDAPVSSTSCRTHPPQTVGCCSVCSRSLLDREFSRYGEQCQVVF